MTTGSSLTSSDQLVGQELASRPVHSLTHNLTVPSRSMMMRSKASRSRSFFN